MTTYDLFSKLLRLALNAGLAPLILLACCSKLRRWVPSAARSFLGRLAESLEAYDDFRARRSEPMRSRMSCEGEKEDFQ